MNVLTTVAETTVMIFETVVIAPKLKLLLIYIPNLLRQLKKGSIFVKLSKK